VYHVADVTHGLQTVVMFAIPAPRHPRLCPIPEFFSHEKEQLASRAISRQGLVEEADNM
jgi:hypothetical protein